MSTSDTNTKFPNVFHEKLLHLASVYKYGLKRNFWLNQSDAAKRLGVRQSAISRGVEIAGWPDEILDFLKAHEDMTEPVAAKLIETERSDGFAVMLARAKEAAPSSDRSARVALAILTGRSARSKRAASLLSDAQTSPSSWRRQPLPADIAKEYYEGLADGRWTSITEAAPLMKRQRIKLNHAVLIDELPSEVKDLFGAAGEMSFSVGNRLRSVQKTIGQPAFIAIARYIRDHREPMITRDLLRAFETVNEESYQGIDIRISVARNGRYLKIESSHLPTLVKDIEKLKSDLMSSLTRSFRRLARTAKAR